MRTVEAGLAQFQRLADERAELQAQNRKLQADLDAAYAHCRHLEDRIEKVTAGRDKAADDRAALAARLLAIAALLDAPPDHEDGR